MRALFFFLLFFGVQSISGQVTENDLLLISNARIHSHDHDHHDNEEGEKRSLLSTINPFRILASGALTVYQKGFSPQLGQRCNYELSCSHFSRASLREFGIIKGVFLSADRILRCNRISYSGIEPIKVNPKTGKVLDSPEHYRAKEK